MHAWVMGQFCAVSRSWVTACDSLPALHESVTGCTDGSGPQKNRMSFPWRYTGGTAESRLQKSAAGEKAGAASQRHGSQGDAARGGPVVSEPRPGLRGNGHAPNGGEQRTPPRVTATGADCVGRWGNRLCSQKCVGRVSPPQTRPSPTYLISPSRCGQANDRSCSQVIFKCVKTCLKCWSFACGWDSLRRCRTL